MISVIIPVYNTEKCLEKCFSSVADQTFKEYEVIMVDDGSTDGSAAICQRFAQADTRFHYYYKANGGSSSARNLGIEKAAGDYIAFIDSDDSIESDYLETLAAPLKERRYDMVQCGMSIHKGDSVTEVLPPATVYSGADYAKAVLKRQFHIFLFITTTTKLYRRELIRQCGVLFDEGIAVSEDCLFNTQLLPHLTNVKQLAYPGYHYIQDNSTLTKTKASYDKAFQSIRIGNITSGIRASLIRQYGWEDDPDVIKGFHTAICIIYLSNAHEIECGHFTKEEKQKLYNSYFSAMDYPVEKTIGDYTGTDKAIIEASVKKDAKTIGRIYQMRELKSKIAFWR